jgi:voltage-gated potassium channel
VALAEPEMVAVKLLYLQADIVKGSEAEIVFHDSGVLRQAIGGIALDKEAVTGVLEVAKHAYRSCAKQVGDGAGEDARMGLYMVYEVSRMRKRIFEIIETSHDGDRASAAYDVFMMVMIVVSLVPLAFKEEPLFFTVLDKVCAGIFIVDYLLRLLTADYKFGKRSALSFVRYPFSFMAIIDLLSVLPSLSLLNSGFKILRVMRMFRALRVMRVFKAARYSRSIQIIIKVFQRSREPLAAVGTLAVVYVLVSALVILSVEPDSFNNFFDAVYWATVSLTTMGYGDIYPVTTLGRIVTMLSSFLLREPREALAVKAENLAGVDLNELRAVRHRHEARREDAGRVEEAGLVVGREAAHADVPALREPLCGDGDHVGDPPFL